MKSISVNQALRYGVILVLAFYPLTGLLAQQESVNVVKMTYFTHLQTGLMIGEESTDRVQKSVIPSFQFISGIRFDEKVGIGLGLGAEPFEYMTYPVFVTVYRYFIGFKNKPYLAAKLGYALSFSHKKFDTYGYSGDFNHKGGLMVHPEFGYQFKWADKDMTLSVGYRFQRLNSSINQSENYSYDHQVDYNRVTFTLGILF